VTARLDARRVLSAVTVVLGAAEALEGCEAEVATGSGESKPLFGDDSPLPTAPPEEARTVVETTVRPATALTPRDPVW